MSFLRSPRTVPPPPSSPTFHYCLASPLYPCGRVCCEEWTLTRNCCCSPRHPFLLDHRFQSSSVPSSFVTIPNDFPPCHTILFASTMLACAYTAAMDPVRTWLKSPYSAYPYRSCNLLLYNPTTMFCSQRNKRRIFRPPFFPPFFHQTLFRPLLKIPCFMVYCCNTRRRL